MHIKTKRRMNQIALAVGMALAAPVALAAVTPTQVPGQGFVAYSGGATIAATLPSTSSETITINSATVNTPVILQWGGSAPSGATLLNSTGSAGFNIGASASTTFDMTNTGAAVLNIDVTSNPSQILGALNVTGSGSAATNLFVANANGIVVGSTAVITAPGGLGLINADLSSTQAQAVYTTGVLPISFAGATNGVQILSGADLSGIGSGTLLVAGAGVVNVTGAQIGASSASHYAFSSSTTLDINGGIGGYYSVSTNTFTPHDSGAAMSFGSLSTSNATSTFSYADAPGTAVSLNLGATTTAPFDAYALSVLANGSIANQGNLTDVNQGTLQWINGTLTNTGQIDFGNQGTSSALIPTTTTATLGFYGSNLYGNTSQAQSAGGFVNASTGLVNGGSFSFTGASFDNEGTIQMGQSSSTAQPYFDVLAFSGNVDVNGSVNVVGASGYTGSTYLGGVSITANTVAGQNINVGVPLTVNGQGKYGASVYLDASGNVVTNKAISVSGASNDNYVTIYAGDYNNLSASSASITVNGPISVSGGLSSYDGIYLQAPGDINVNGALSAIGNGDTYITAKAGYISNTSYGPGVLNISAPITVQAGGMSGASSTQYGYLMLSGANGVNVNAPVSMSVLPSSAGIDAYATAEFSVNALHGSLNTGTSGSISVSALASASGYNEATLETDSTASFIAANNVNLGAPINLNVSATGGSSDNYAYLLGTILPVNGSGSVTIGTGASIGVNVLASGTGRNTAEFTLNKNHSPATPTITGTNVYAPITVNVTASGSDTSNYADMTGFGLNGGIGSLLLASGAPLTVNVSATSPSNAISPGNTAYFAGGMGAAQTVTLNAPVNINVTASPSVDGLQYASAYLSAAATNMAINQSLDMDAASGWFEFAPVGGRNGSVQQGVFSVASGSMMLMAPNLYLGTSSYNGGQAQTAYTFDGQVMASGNGANNGAVTIGGYNAYVTNISGTGSIAAGTLTVNNLLGNFNNIQTGQILSNGFQLIAPSTAPMGISVSAVGNVAQGVNLAIDGSAVVDSGSTQTVGTQTPAGNTSATQYLYPANANSIFVAQATGNMTVDAGNTSGPAYAVSNTGVGGFFQWPGLVYVKGDTGMTVNAAIANAFGAAAQMGREGVYVIGPSITMNQPVYTNTAAGVVFANANYGYTSINGNALGMNPVMVYFAQPQTLSVGGGNALFTMQPNGTFVNEKGYSQEMQTFLTLP